MAGECSWIDTQFNAIQTLGIVASLWMAIVTGRREARAKEAENLLAISEQHAQLWAGSGERQDLARIFQRDADIRNPLSPAEAEFLRLVVSHFQTIWLIAKRGGLLTLQELALDAGDFFSLPLPRAVWEETKRFRNPKFVRFVEKAIDTHSRPSPDHA